MCHTITCTGQGKFSTDSSGEMPHCTQHRGIARVAAKGWGGARTSTFLVLRSSSSVEAEGAAEGSDPGGAPLRDGAHLPARAAQVPAERSRARPGSGAAEPAVPPAPHWRRSRCELEECVACASDRGCALWGCEGTRAAAGCGSRCEHLRIKIPTQCHHSRSS